MNWIQNDIPDCITALSVPRITAVHTSNAGIRWWTRGHGRFAGDEEKNTGGALFDMLTFRPDSAISFLTALKEPDRHARTQGQPIWVKPGSPVPESPETQRDRPAHTVRIPKQALKPGKQAELTAKNQLVLPPKKRFQSSASNSDSDRDIDSNAERGDKSNKSHRSDKSDKSSASDQTRPLPDLPICQSLNWMWIPIKLNNVGSHAFPPVPATEFTSPKRMVPVPIRRQSQQPGWSTYWMP